MDNKINKGDTFIEKMSTDWYSVVYVDYTYKKDNQDVYDGIIYHISKSGVLTHFNVDITREVNKGIPIPESFYGKIIKRIDKALLEASSILFRVKHEKLEHLKEGSCYVFVEWTDGQLLVNQVSYFEAISYDGPGVYEVEMLDEEGGEVHNESFCLGTRNFNKEYTFIRRDSLDEDNAFIISKKAYNRIVQVHTKLITDLMELFDTNASLLDL